MKAEPSIKTPAQYLASLPEPRRGEIRKLHAIIRKTAPELKPFLVHGMLGYGPHHYRYASGHEGDTGIVCLASQKHHIGLYLFGCEDEISLAKKYGPNLGKVKIGVGCIRFKKLTDIDLAAFEKIIRQSASWAAKK